MLQYLFLTPSPAQVQLLPSFAATRLADLLHLANPPSRLRAFLYCRLVTFAEGIEKYVLLELKGKTLWTFIPR